MKIDRTLFFLPYGFLVVSILVPFAGCFQQSKPDGLPDLVPLQVRLEQDGKPLEGASVQLYSESCDWAIMGNTDSTGVAVIATHGRYVGAPLGTFKVLVFKSETENQLSPDQKTMTKSTYDLVDPAYADAATTPLEITVEKKTRLITLDAGKPTRKIVESMASPYRPFP